MFEIGLAKLWEAGFEILDVALAKASQQGFAGAVFMRMDKASAVPDTIILGTADGGSGDTHRVYAPILSATQQFGLLRCERARNAGERHEVEQLMLGHTKSFAKTVGGENDI